jgi:hypothetical protein
VPEGQEKLSDEFRRHANQLARAWALCSGSQSLAELRRTAKFYEEVRVWMGKFDAQERQAQGKPVPEDIQRMLSSLVATSTASGDIVDIYDAAGLPKPSLSDLGPDFVVKAQASSNPHLAIEALRDLLLEESEAVTRHNLVRQRAFSERIKELMRKYTNQQLTSAEVIAELIEMAKDVTAERNAGRSSPRRCRRTSWPSTTLSPPTSPPSRCRARASWHRSPASWSSSCAATSRPTGPYVTTSGRSSGSRSSACWSSTSTHRTSSPRPSSSSSSRWRPWPLGTCRGGIALL